MINVPAGPPHAEAPVGFFQEKEVVFVKAAHLPHRLGTNQHAGADDRVHLKRFPVIPSLAGIAGGKQCFQDGFIEELLSPGWESCQRNSVCFRRCRCTGRRRSPPRCLIHKGNKSLERPLGKRRIGVEQEKVAPRGPGKGLVVGPGETQVQVILNDGYPGNCSCTALTLPSSEPLSTTMISTSRPDAVAKTEERQLSRSSRVFQLTIMIETSMSRCCDREGAGCCPQPES